MPTKLEKAHAELATLPSKVPAGTRWKHLKNGNDYMVHGYTIIEATVTPAVIYAPYGQPFTWCRPASEFLDGRFRNVTEL